MRPSRCLLKGGWFEAPPERSKFHYCQAVCNVPGFPTDKPIQDPYWMEDALSGYHKYQKYGPSITTLKQCGMAWKGDEEKGIPPMPPADHFGNKLIPRDEAEKFMPDIFIDGLADEIQGPLRSMGKHIVPHQFHEFYDESLVAEGAFGRREGHDRSRDATWKANLSMYVHRHHLADDMQRKMLIGGAREQDRYQDPDDTEYEQEVLAALRKGDIDLACSTYRKLADPPRDWSVYLGLMRAFAARGLLADAVALYDEMEILSIPPNGAVLSALAACAVEAEHPMRVVWVVNEARRGHGNGALKVPADQLAEIATRAVRYLLDASPILAVRVYESVLVGGESTEAAAAEVSAKARQLGILPPSSVEDFAYRHRYASPPPDPDADHPVPPPPPALPLTPEELKQLRSLSEVQDPVMPYFKKSQPCHVLQKGVLRSFKYDMAKVNPVPRYPSFRAKNVMGAELHPAMRFAFRWDGPKTRMVQEGSDTSPDMWIGFEE